MTAAAFDNILARRLNTFVELWRKELKILAELQHNPFKAQRGQLLLQEGETDPTVFILQAGWGCSYKLLPNGSRQIRVLVLISPTQSASRTDLPTISSRMVALAVLVARSIREAETTLDTWYDQTKLMA
jgi:hypothetical protein